MKYATLLSFLLIPFLSWSQDLIITNSGDSIECTITLVNDANIFYTYKKKKRQESTYISLQEVSTYINNGKEAQPKAPVEDYTATMAGAQPTVVVPARQRSGLGAIITGFLLQGIGSIFTIVATAGILDIQDGRPIVYIASGLNVLGVVLIVSGFQKNQD